MILAECSTSSVLVGEIYERVVSSHDATDEAYHDNAATQDDLERRSSSAIKKHSFIRAETFDCC